MVLAPYPEFVKMEAILSGAASDIVELSTRDVVEYSVVSPHVQILDDFRAEVVKVHDGDTVTLRADFRDFDFPLRFAHIDAPELNAGGGLARDWLSERLLGKVVDVFVDRDNRVGKFGRLIGEVFVDGLNVGFEMLRLGLVFPFGTPKDRIVGFDHYLKKGGY